MRDRAHVPSARDTPRPLLDPYPPMRPLRSSTRTAAPLAVLLFAIALAACGTTRPAPRLADERAFAAPPRSVFDAALRVALVQRYEIVSSDAAGGVLRLRRYQHRRVGVIFMRESNEHLTLVLTSHGDGTRVQAQTFATRVPDVEDPEESLVDDKGQTRAAEFLDDLNTALNAASAD